MATTISNPATFSSVRTAFNAEGYGISTSLYAYRQGGGIVPATSGFDVIGAGTSGDPLRLSQFNGFTVPSPVVISISNDSVSVDTVYESDFDYNIANYGIKSNGLIYATGYSSVAGTFDGTTHNTNWVTPTTAASGYEVRATLVTGNTPIGPALNTWHACTSDRIWYLDLTGFGQYSCTLTIDIRDTATSTIRDTASITLFVKIGV